MQGYFLQAGKQRSSGCLDWAARTAGARRRRPPSWTIEPKWSNDWATADAGVHMLSERGDPLALPVPPTEARYVTDRGETAVVTGVPIPDLKEVADEVAGGF